MDQNSLDAFGSNKNLLMQILRDNQNTEYGKKYDFANIHSIEEFQEKVPYTTFDDYAPYIERMVKNGEKNLITAYPVIHYAETSGSRCSKAYSFNREIHGGLPGLFRYQNVFSG
jgi:hypothetical protein